MEHEDCEDAAEKSASKTHYTKRMLMARGWTKAMIDQLLGTPDKVRLWYGERTFHYAVARVLAAEQTPEYARRKERAQRRVATKSARRNAALEAISEIAFPIPVLDVAELTRRAIAAYNHTVESPTLRASARSDQSLLAYLSVHWLRHQSPEYTRAIASTKGKPGRWEAYFHARDRLLATIATTYPHLAEECAYQRSEDRDPARTSHIKVEDFEAVRPNRDEIACRLAAKRRAAGIPEFPGRITRTI